MQFLIRKATLDDANDMAYIHTITWKTSYRGLVPDWYLDSLSVEESIKKTKEKFEMCSVARYVGVLDEKIIAILVIQKCYDEDKPESGEIGALYVLPEYQSSGYGKQLMSFAITELKNQGFNNIIVWTLKDSVQSNTFYQNCGFKLEGAVRNINIINSTAVRYCMDL